MDTEAEHKIEFTICERDFLEVFGRMPKNREEFDRFAEHCEKGLKAHIDWNIVLDCAKEAME